jgi:hypothetical protein
LSAGLGIEGKASEFTPNLEGFGYSRNGQGFSASGFDFLYWKLARDRKQF